MPVFRVDPRRFGTLWSCRRPAGSRQQSPGLLHCTVRISSPDKKHRSPEWGTCVFGGPEEIRTPDPYNANVMRSQLRYGPMRTMEDYTPQISNCQGKLLPSLPSRIFSFSFFSSCGKIAAEYTQRSVIMQSICEILAQELGQKQEYVENVISLISEK